MEKPTRLALLKEIAEFLNEETEIYSMMQGALRLLINGSDFSTGWIFYIDEEGHHDLVSSVDLPEALSKNHCYYLTNGSCWCVQAYQNHKLTKASNIINCSRINLAKHAYDKETNHITHHATVPLQSGSERFGLLNVASPNKEHYSEEDLELLESVAFQIGSAIKRIQLTNKEKENAKINERNRLARDLHDSVNQMLFSLKLTAHAAKGITTDEQAQRAFKTIEETSQNAVNEMRALIWQLKPVGLEQGLIHALHYYSKMLGLDLKVTINGLIDLSNDIEENVYRIIQEAMNNVIKHAKTNKVYLDLSQNVDYLEVDIRDNGQGFDTQSINTFLFNGLKNIKQRTQYLNGKVTIESKINQGTRIYIKIPLKLKEHPYA